MVPLGVQPGAVLAVGVAVVVGVGVAEVRGAVAVGVHRRGVEVVVAGLVGVGDPVAVGVEVAPVAGAVVVGVHRAGAQPIVAGLVDVGDGVAVGVQVASVDSAVLIGVGADRGAGAALVAVGDPVAVAVAQLGGAQEAAPVVERHPADGLGRDRTRGAQGPEQVGLDMEPLVPGHLEVEHRLVDVGVPHPGAVLGGEDHGAVPQRVGREVVPVPSDKGDHVVAQPLDRLDAVDVGGPDRDLAAGLEQVEPLALVRLEQQLARGDVHRLVHPARDQVGQDHVHVGVREHDERPSARSGPPGGEDELGADVALAGSLGVEGRDHGVAVVRGAAHGDVAGGGDLVDPAGLQPGRGPVVELFHLPLVHHRAPGLGDGHLGVLGAGHKEHLSGAGGRTPDHEGPPHPGPAAVGGIEVAPGEPAALMTLVDEHHLVHVDAVVTASGQGDGLDLEPVDGAALDLDAAVQLGDGVEGPVGQADERQPPGLARWMIGIHHLLSARPARRDEPGQDQDSGKKGWESSASAMWLSHGLPPRRQQRGIVASFGP